MKEGLREGRRERGTERGEGERDGEVTGVKWGPGDRHGGTGTICLEPDCLRIARQPDQTDKPRQGRQTRTDNPPLPGPSPSRSLSWPATDERPKTRPSKQPLKLPRHCMTRP